MLFHLLKKISEFEFNLPANFQKIQIVQNDNDYFESVYDNLNIESVQPH